MGRVITHYRYTDTGYTAPASHPPCHNHQQGHEGAGEGATDQPHHHQDSTNYKVQRSGIKLLLFLGLTARQKLPF